MTFVAILIFIIGFVLGNAFTMWRMLINYKHDPNFVIQFLEKWTTESHEDEDYDPREELFIYVEEEDDRYYAYNSENNRFIASGTTLEQCIRSVVDIHPGMKITCSD